MGEKASAGHCCKGASGVPLDGTVLIRVGEPKQRYLPDPNNDLKVHSISNRSGQEDRQIVESIFVTVISS